MLSCVCASRGIVLVQPLEHILNPPELFLQVSVDQLTLEKQRTVEERHINFNSNIIIFFVSLSLTHFLKCKVFLFSTSIFNLNASYSARVILSLKTYFITTVRHLHTLFINTIRSFTEMNVCS